jgi:hypothetical protein
MIIILSVGVRNSAGLQQLPGLERLTDVLKLIFPCYLSVSWFK